MKILIVSYSLTGNNEALANRIASELQEKHIVIRELRRRTTGTIFLDNLLNRIPEVRPIVENFADYELIVFIAPVWMGHFASPLRAYFKYFGKTIRQYVYISISGGADGPNSKLADELTKRIGKKPAAVIDLHIADLLPSVPKPTRKITSAYRLNEKEVTILSAKVVQELQKILLQSASKEKNISIFA